MYSEAEIGLIKKYFAENDHALKNARRILFGFPIKEEDKQEVIALFKQPKAVDLFQRKLFAKLNPEAPLGTANDFWLGAEQQVFGASRDAIVQTVQAKEMVLEAFEKALEALTGGEMKIIEVKSLEADPLQSSLIARNLFIKAVETALYTLTVIAGQKEESPEQAVKRLKQNSSK